MEFTRLAEVEVVETATDTDKVLIEQNGEIKRVPKTEVGGGAGNTLILDVTIDPETETVNGVANMTLEETIAAVSNHELSGVALYTMMEGVIPVVDMGIIADYSAMAGKELVMFQSLMTDMMLFWTADGFSVNPPEGLG